MKQCIGCFEKYNEKLGMCPYCGFFEGDEIEARSILPGEVLNDKYIVGKVLGHGGFGVTYCAWDKNLDRKVAIKEYLPTEFCTRSIGENRVTVFQGEKAEQFEAGLDRFVSESKRLFQFRNADGIVKIFDTFNKNNTAYIVMENLDGGTLAQYLSEKGTVSEEECIRLMMPVIKSLEIIHNDNIIHRDIAPDNIIITKGGEAKLIDFGAARYATTSHSRSLTTSVKTGFSPEEQYRSRGDQGPHTDVYALAATMYKMVTGETTPDALERRASIEGKKKELLVEPSKYAKELSSNFEIALLNALNVRIEDRTANMQEFEKELTSTVPLERKVNNISKIDILKWPLWAKISASVTGLAVLTLSVLFAMGIIGFDANLQTLMTIPTGLTRVPSIMSEELEVAETELNDKILLYEIVGKEYSDLIPKDYVLIQEIRAGSLVNNNTVVGIVISAGEEEVLTLKDEEGRYTLADVQFKTQEDALAALAIQEMTVVIEEEYSDTVAAGVVISQEPAAGTKLLPNQEIKLIISKGSTAFDMVEVSGKTEEEAIAELTALGLVVTTQYKNDDTVPEGTVISQSVVVGDEITRGTEVILVVSSGDELIEVVDVAGLSLSSARSRLEELGFIVEVNQANDSTKNQVVVSQSPSGGASVKTGSLVIITVMGEEEQVATPKPAPVVTPAPAPVVTPTPAPVPTQKPSTTTSTWSSWTTDASKASDSSYQVETKEQYSYRDKETTTSTQANLSGWTHDDTTTIWTEWSAWSNDVVTAIEGERQVETNAIPTTYKTVWHYSRDTKYDAGGNLWSTYSIGTYGNPEYITLDYRLSVTGSTDGMTSYGSYGSGTARNLWWNERSEDVVAQHGYTQYRYSDAIHTYHYHRWSEFSAWSDNVASASATREVKTQTLYRYKKK